MKLLLFVDVHSNKKHLDSVIKKSKNADIFVCLGDLTMFQNNMVQMLKKLDKLGKTVLMLPGNHELEEDLQEACDEFKNIAYFHMDTKEVDDYLFLSYGSGGFIKQDPRFERAAKQWEKVIKKHHKIILLTHGPPYGVSVDIISGEHTGNKSITKFIKKHKPIIAACGHLHENFSKVDKIGETMIINPGPGGKIVNV